MTLDKNGTLKILGIWPQPTADERAAIAAALAEFGRSSKLDRYIRSTSKWLRSGRTYPTAQTPRAPFELFEPTKWLAAARTEALDDSL